MTTLLDVSAGTIGMVLAFLVGLVCGYIKGHARARSRGVLRCWDCERAFGRDTSAGMPASRPPPDPERRRPPVPTHPIPPFPIPPFAPYREIATRPLPPREIVVDDVRYVRALDETELEGEAST